MTAGSTNNLGKYEGMWGTHDFDSQFCDGTKRLGFEVVVIFIANGNPISSATIPKKFGGNNYID